ncbi:hypothetical protein BpHYR1_008681 [Brachionus plicatilis]|uniref:Uncharacterized protein n=1 Tax=Brachionus plicatilis TaxID=10195 RepID=A0A3M7PLK1_BRAPC|nr:hypothetical protein BpHYR1_008681 [Brachionus plicatilis]
MKNSFISIISNILKIKINFVSFHFKVMSFFPYKLLNIKSFRESLIQFLIKKYHITSFNYAAPQAETRF